jgi:hypothetical protein
MVKMQLNMAQAPNPMEEVRAVFDDICLIGEVESVVGAWFEALKRKPHWSAPLNLGNFLVGWQIVRTNAHKHRPKLPDVREIFDQVAVGKLSPEAGVAKISAVMHEIREEGYKKGLQDALGAQKLEDDDQCLLFI